MSINVPIIWILGGPACGKGTQCEKIVEKYKFTHLSTGDLLRAEIATGSQKGQELSALMQQGKLVPNDDVLFLLEKAIRNRLDKTNGFLIDGYPREKEQGLEFERRIAPVDLVIYLELPDETMIMRSMHRAANAAIRRADDTQEIIKRRIAIFRANTKDITHQYADKLVTVDARRSIDEMFCDVVCVIEAMLQNKEGKQAKINAQEQSGACHCE